MSFHKIPKITQLWFIHETILDGLLLQSPPYFAALPHSRSRSSLSSLVCIVQSFCGMCLALIDAYKQALNTVKRVQIPRDSWDSSTHFNPTALLRNPRHLPCSDADSTTSTHSVANLIDQIVILRPSSVDSTFRSHYLPHYFF